jgi:hypothetical protein
MPEPITTLYDEVRYPGGLYPQTHPNQLITIATLFGLGAHSALGNTVNYLGEFDAAQAHVAQGIALYDPQQHHARAVRYRQDVGCSAKPMPP